MAEIYTVVICEIEEPGKAPDVKYVNFSEVSVGFASVSHGSIIEYLRETHKYSNDTVIRIKDVHYFNNRADFAKFLG
jgi:hypothetical protein